MIRLLIALLAAKDYRIREFATRTLITINTIFPVVLDHLDYINYKDIEIHNRLRYINESFYWPYKYPSMRYFPHNELNYIYVTGLYVVENSEIESFTNRWQVPNYKKYELLRRMRIDEINSTKK